MESFGAGEEAQAIDDDGVELLELENAVLRAHLARLEASAPDAHVRYFSIPSVVRMSARASGKRSTKQECEKPCLALADG